ncbi:MAG: metallophosphoesterase [Deltaproteobacteria bacterium]|nr:metallophosphoesterase [Deltaproteobacteria bacterium]
MKIAHISDLHVLALDEVSPHRLLNKRLTGWANLKFRRSHEHQAYALSAVARALRERVDIDHVVVTGDLTNLALESEFEAAHAFLQDELGLEPSKVSVIPGNHDAYTRGAYESRRFERRFHDYISSDLPGASSMTDNDAFPFVRLRGPVALIGLTTAVPRPPLVASGEVGKVQLLALHALLAHAEVRSRFPILLLHHPWHRPPSLKKALLDALDDRDALREVLDGLSRGLLLHGHLHRRMRRKLGTANGELDVIGATSASLVHHDADRRSGFNVYEVDERGLVHAEGFRLDERGGRFEPAVLPSH